MLQSRDAGDASRDFGGDLTNVNGSENHPGEEKVKTKGIAIGHTSEKEPYSDKVYCMKEIFDFLIPREVELISFAIFKVLLRFYLLWL